MVGKSIIKFCKSFINLTKLVTTRTCSSARVRARRGPARMCAQSSGPFCWQSLKGSRPCLPPEGSWGVADGAAARRPLHRRPRWRPRPPAVATIPGGLERPLHQTRPPQGRPRPASLELRHAAVRSRTWPQLGPRRGLALRGRRQGRRGLALPQRPEPSQLQEQPPIGPLRRKQDRHRLQNRLRHSLG